MIPSFYKISYMIKKHFSLASKQLVMNWATLSLNNHLHATWHGSNQVTDHCRVQLLPNLLQDVAILLDRPLGLRQCTMEGGEALVELDLQHLPDIFDGVEIRRLRWPAHHFDLFLSKKVSDVSGSIAWGFILHEDKVIWVSDNNCIFINHSKNIIFEEQQALSKDFDILLATDATGATNDEWTKLVPAETTPDHYANSFRLERRTKAGWEEPGSSEDHRLMRIEADLDTGFIGPNNVPPLFNCPILMLQCPLQMRRHMMRCEMGFHTSNALVDTEFF